MKQPPLSPIEKRQLLVQSYLESYRLAGIKADPRSVEKLVIADCELVDAAERAGELSGGGTPDPSPPKPRRDVIGDAERATGAHLVEPDPAQAWRPRFRFTNPQTVSEQWGAAVARWARILSEGTHATPTGTQFIGRLAQLAREAKTLEACFHLRNLPPHARGFSLNEFDGLVDRDAARLYMRRVIDICDRSTGVLGHWYVK